MSSPHVIVNEAGMCVVSPEQIQRRLSSMEKQEMSAVNEISVPFLFYLSRMAHNHNLEDVKGECVDLTKIIPDVIKTFRDDPIELERTKIIQEERNTNSEIMLNAMVESVATSAFNPSNVLSLSHITLAEATWISV